MIWRKQAFTTVFAALLAFSCGGVSRSQPPETTATGGSAGTGIGGSAGNATGGNTAQGGASGSAAGGSAGTAGSGGSGLGGASGGTAGKTGRGSVPGETPDERDILEPLGTDDATIDAASGSDLVDLAQAIGIARGYAMCRCALSPEGPPEDAVRVMQCAMAETGADFVQTPDQARCIADRMSEVSGFEGYVRCAARSERDYALDWTEVCASPGSMPEFPPTCEPPAGAEALIFECGQTIYCPDGARVTGRRCDTLPDCPNLADERNCYELGGRDLLLCGDALTHPMYLCSQPACATIAICDPNGLPRFRCTDGSDIDPYDVCDRVNDCVDGSDETSCLR